jgi:hypothetical protein
MPCLCNPASLPLLTTTITTTTTPTFVSAFLATLKSCFIWQWQRCSDFLRLWLGL